MQVDPHTASLSAIRPVWGPRLSRRPAPSAGGRAAELEFGFAHRDASGVRFRFYARCVIRDSGGTGILWFFAPAGDWAEASTHIDTFRLD
ncbi:hypothetical protein AB0J63_02000 [Streptosporangium canum]|uniref:hypothetical protein n=1 Tax=Streptosporangium canum TaxID=324952 RepID=UPI00343505A8